MGPGFVLSEEDEQRLPQVIASPVADPELNGLQAVGWYHSHIRTKIFLSHRDLQIHSRYFGAPFQVALVLHPRSNRPLRAGFFFRESSGAIRTESSYEEFTLESALPKPKPFPARSGALAPPQRSTLPEPACPKCCSKQIRRAHRMNSLDRLRCLLGYRPYRCQECLSRFFLKTSSDLRERIHSKSGKRREELRRARLRTRREILLWGGGILGFLAILRYLIREPLPKSDQP